MNLDLDALATGMLDAARKELAGRWPSRRAMAEIELRKLAANLVDIERLVREEAIDREGAQKLVQIYQLTVRSVLCTVDGIGLHTAERLTRTALNAVGAVVNRAIGFRLI